MATKHLRALVKDPYRCVCIDLRFFSAANPITRNSVGPCSSGSMWVLREDSIHAYGTSAHPVDIYKMILVSLHYSRSRRSPCTSNMRYVLSNLACLYCIRQNQDWLQKQRRTKCRQTVCCKNMAIIPYFLVAVILRAELVIPDISELGDATSTSVRKVGRKI